ncbi:HPr kinase/phosphorylase [Sphingomonas sp. PAMC 26605]|uniref:HPr kinase/phosphorylase n=1 Tax=Sphingomonas sp. PAMC 26605 TaxID=1112214 RepID=UPI00026CD743|nr:ATP-binding protein [Sphingomonas sp. PAMC 26605]
MSLRIHATTVAIGGHGVMLLGPSGSGKSDLALRLIDRGARLVSDDYSEVRTIAGVVHAAPPASIAGKIEVRGLGIRTMPYIPEIAVALVIRLGGTVARMPEPGESTDVGGVAVPMVALDAFEASAPIKVELALEGVRETL